MVTTNADVEERLLDLVVIINREIGETETESKRHVGGVRLFLNTVTFDLYTSARDVFVGYTRSTVGDMVVRERVKIVVSSYELLIHRKGSCGRRFLSQTIKLEEPVNPKSLESQ